MCIVLDARRRSWPASSPNRAIFASASRPICGGRRVGQVADDTRLRAV
jgi:hypothetical protein